MEVVTIRPIPKKLLIHTIELYPKVQKDRWGKEEKGDSVAISRIRMEPSNKIVRDKNKAEIQLSALLFYDCRNSIPSGSVFSLDDIVTFNGEKFSIKTIELLYDGKKLHHYEMGLIRHA